MQMSLLLWNRPVAAAGAATASFLPLGLISMLLFRLSQAPSLPHLPPPGCGSEQSCRRPLEWKLLHGVSPGLCASALPGAGAAGPLPICHIVSFVL